MNIIIIIEYIYIFMTYDIWHLFMCIFNSLGGRCLCHDFLSHKQCWIGRGWWVGAMTGSIWWPSGKLTYLFTVICFLFATCECRYNANQYVQWIAYKIFFVRSSKLISRKVGKTSQINLGNWGCQQEGVFILIFLFFNLFNLYDRAQEETITNEYDSVFSILYLWLYQCKFYCLES
jgi:hypothetical protein